MYLNLMMFGANYYTYWFSAHEPERMAITGIHEALQHPGATECVS